MARYKASTGFCVLLKYVLALAAFPAAFVFVGVFPLTSSSKAPLSASVNGSFFSLIPVVLFTSFTAPLISLPNPLVWFSAICLTPLGAISR